MVTSAESRLVAVFGAGRNGSTLLGRLLDGSPGLWAHPPEVNYLCAWNDLAAGDRISISTRQNATTRPLRRLDARLPAELLLAEYRGQWDEIEELYIPSLAEPVQRRVDPAELLQRQAEWDVAAFLPAFLEATRLAYGDRTEEPHFLLFKTIETPYVEDYLRVFPGLRCLHIVRNPVDNFASAKRTWSIHKDFAFYHFGHDQLRTFLDARWLPHARAMLRLAEADPEQHRIVRYEDLSFDPTSILAGICTWLGVDPPPDPAQLTVLGGRRFERMPSNPSQPGIEPPSRVVPNMAEAFGYTDVLSTRERALVAHATTRLAQRLGYEDAAPGGPLAALRLWLRWLPVDGSERLNIRRRGRFAVEILRRRLYLTRLLARRRRSA